MSGPPVWRLAAAGMCSSLVGIGLARFAYTPLLPAVIAAGWFTPGQAAYLGAANLAGYLAGAVAARPLAARFPARPVLRAMMLLATLTFFGSAAPVSLLWFFGWRFLAGWAGGVLMVLAAPTILPFVSANRRGLASGAIFTGVGIGIAASGVLVPPLLRFGVQQAWLGLGVLAALFTAVAWFNWPAAPVRAAAPAAEGPVRGLRTVMAVYGLNAVGLVPHMVFLVDYVARGLGRGMAAGAGCWVAFGLGAVVGPTLTGTLADRIGFRAAVRLALTAQVLVVAAPLVSQQPLALLASATLAGGFTPGVVPLALGRIHQLVAPGSNAARAAWSHATTAWAIGQAAAAYALSYIFSLSGASWPLFTVGCAGLLLALGLDLSTGRQVSHATAGT